MNRNKIIGDAYKQHYNLFFARVYYYVQNEEVAHDLVHDVFLNLLESDEDIRSIEHCKALLLIRVRYRAIDHYRSAHRNRTKYPDVLPETIDTAFEQSSLLILETPFATKVASKLQLTEDEFHLLNLLLDGYRTKEVADQLGVSAKIIAQRKYRLLEKIRKSIQ